MIKANVSPGGTTVNSQGRQPLDGTRRKNQSPVGAIEGSESAAFLSPLRGSRELAFFPQGLAPLAIHCRRSAAGRSRRFCVIACCLFFLFSSLLFPLPLARGALDPETDKPYRLQVVLRIAENRLLTPVFRDLVERQLRESLQAALGDLASVEVVRQHPLLKEVEAKGLQAALDGYSILSDAKIHFVLVDFVDGLYEIQARQHDGFTGLASPVRRSSTADRQLVARLATLLIDQDFGLAGTVEQIQGDRVTVKLKGGRLGARLGYWLQKDQVFAVIQIMQGSAQQRRSFRMPLTLLQVLEEPRGEACRCRLLSRPFKDPLPQAPSVLGYRCLKLGTTEAPLRLRVVVRDDKLGTPVPNAQVRISTRGFGVDDILDTVSTNQDGLVRSPHSYKHVAFVRILTFEKLVTQVPIEIIQDQTITCPVNVSAETAAQGELLYRREQWLRHVNDGLDVANNLVKELNAMAAMTEPSSESALRRAQAGLTALQNDISNLTAEHAGLSADGVKESPRGEEGLKQLQGLHDTLQGFIGELQANVTKEKDPKRKELIKLAAQAKFQEQEAEFDAAIKLYKQVQAQGEDTPELRAKIAALEGARKPKNKQHEKAQAFIFDAWPKLETATQINARLEEARLAFSTCREVGDTLSPQKLLKAYAMHTERLAKEGDTLQPQDKEDDRKTAQLIIDLSQKLKEFNEQVKEYLRKAQPTQK